ncbi:MAG: hypothetical protein MK240_10210 [Opitutales bacterium]|nr:hypothetical protein [Opitutales bacterium]
MSDRPGLSLPEPNKLTSPILTLLKTAKPKPTPKGQASNEEVFRAAAPCGFTGGSAQDDAKKLVNLPIWGMAGSEDGKNPAGIRKMVERLRAAGNMSVKHTEFEGADHREGGRAVFSSVKLVDWMLGFSKN